MNKILSSREENSAINETLHDFVLFIYQTLGIVEEPSGDTDELVSQLQNGLILLDEYQTDLIIKIGTISMNHSSLSAQIKEVTSRVTKLQNALDSVLEVQGEAFENALQIMKREGSAEISNNSDVIISFTEDQLNEAVQVAIAVFNNTVIDAFYP